MPANLAVYQPTTVSFETRPGLLSQTVPGQSIKLIHNSLFQIVMLILSLILLATGITMVASGSADYSDTENHKEELNIHVPYEGIDIGLIVTGCIVTILGFLILGIYIKVTNWRRYCICNCPISKKQGLARQQLGNGGQIALNPSTDPLVSHTQYAPVSEIPTRQDDEERRNLMPDNKESCVSSAEESDRMLDVDPRIVLRPTGNIDEV
uniref:Putative conserved plasma membrane protein n=1 Tax=Corethrella appendiculata TaxID=1370023 RepID=U5EDG7_9DIPT